MTMEERLDHLERELARAKRRNHWLLPVAALAVGGLTLPWTLTKTTPAAQAQGAGAEKVIRASAFVLEDEQGRKRGELAMGPLGSVLGLFDANGKPRVILSAVKDGPSLELLDENGTVRNQLNVGQAVRKPSMVVEKPVVRVEAPAEKWRDKGNWRLLQKGMSKQQVRQLLGEPPHIDASTFPGDRWDYPDVLGGTVQFGNDDQVRGWKEP